jgi:H/ACA ribonucleoprotein complex subunit 3
LAILKCSNCKRYTIKNECPVCKSKELMNVHPPKFSPLDKYLEIKFQAIIARKGKIKAP